MPVVLGQYAVKPEECVFAGQRFVHSGWRCWTTDVGHVGQVRRGRQQREAFVPNLLERRAALRSERDGEVGDRPVFRAPHECVQPVQSPHEDMTQSTGHGPVLQRRRSLSAGHSTPPKLTSVSI